MTKVELVEKARKNARDNGVYIDQHRAEQIIDSFLNTIVEMVESGEHVNISGFGKFESVEKKRTTFVHPITKEEIRRGKYLQPKFIPDKMFKERVRGVKYE